MRAILLILICTLLLPVHAGDSIHVNARTDDKGVSSVHKVDFCEAPELKELAGRARQIGDQVYPQILALLAEGTSKSPRQFDIVFKRQVEGGNVAQTHDAVIDLSAGWFAKSPGDLEMILVHEMSHVAQQYGSGAPFHWGEGMADFVCFKLGRTNAWACPVCSTAYPHYTSGYTCAGAFLLYLDANYGPNIIRQLNTVLRKGSYSDKFFSRATGKKLEALWAEFQQTPAFTPAAAETLKLQKSLGFVNGKPPKDLQARLKQLPGGAQTLEAGEFLKSLVKSHQLPGILKDERGNFTGSVDPLDLVKETNSENYPIIRTFHCRKSDEPSLYHYTLARVAKEAAWKLQKAWRTSPDGRIMEAFSIRLAS